MPENKKRAAAIAKLAEKDIDDLLEACDEVDDATSLRGLGIAANCGQSKRPSVEQCQQQLATLLVDGLPDAKSPNTLD